MKYQKGQSGNPEGRPLGAKDKTNKEIRETFKTLVEGNLSEIQNWITLTAQKDPAKAIDVVLKLSEFCIPKLKATELTTNLNDQKIVVIPPDWTNEERNERINELKKKLFEED